MQNINKFYKSFIQTRVQLIRERFFRCWHLVCSHFNPAVIVSRLYDLNDLVKNDVWFKGPTFLTLPESRWPHFTIGDKFNLGVRKEEEVKCKVYSVYNKSNNACIQSIDVNSILNNHDKDEWK